MKKLVQLFLTASIFVLTLSAAAQPVSAQGACVMNQRILNCICQGVEVNGFCLPADTNSCYVRNNTECVCGTATYENVVNMMICRGGTFCPYNQPMSGGCTCDGRVGAGNICLPPTTGPGSGVTDNVFGSVDAPPGIAQYNSAAAGGIGLIPFISNLIRIATIVAGIIVFLNFILAGYAYISSDGSSKVNEEVKNKLTYSVIGLLIIVASYTIIAIISLLLFGRADFILNPTITGPTP